MVASDRISTYDAVHPTPIPDKGKVLTGLSVFWFEKTRRDRRQPPDLRDRGRARGSARPGAGRAQARDAAGRVRRARLHHGVGLEGLPGHGRGLGDRAAGRDCASPSSWRSRSSRRARRPTSATTRRSTSRRRRELVGDGALMERVRDKSIELYSFAAEHARERGVILADTKFEFGLDERRRAGRRRRGAHARLLALLAGRHLRGRAGASRASTSSTCATGPRGSGWDKRPPAPEIPRGRRRGHARAVRRGVRADHRRAVHGVAGAHGRGA